MGEVEKPGRSLYLGRYLVEEEKPTHSVAGETYSALINDGICPCQGEFIGSEKGKEQLALF